MAAMPAGSRPERYHVDFTVFLTWQDARRIVHTVTGRCLDLSSSGIRIETRDTLTQGQMVVIQSDHFGRMGHASVRYCRREAMKYVVGLQFTTLFELGDPVRRKILDGVLSKASGSATTSGSTTTSGLTMKPERPGSAPKS
jgi:hypothetical protein